MLDSVLTPGWTSPRCYITQQRKTSKFWRLSSREPTSTRPHDDWITGQCLRSHVHVWKRQRTHCCCSRLAPGQRTSLKNACRRSSKHILRFTSRASEDTPGTRRRERACCSSSSLNNLAPYLAAASPASLPSTSPPSLPPSSRCAAPTQTPTSSQLKEEGQATLNTPICPTVCGHLDGRALLSLLLTSLLSSKRCSKPGLFCPRMIAVPPFCQRTRARRSCFLRRCSKWTAYVPARD
mmetsp:Transcript_30530/g.73339  ORF Transcript_30530/g.73339 Transcript_30530/m.73339 type:complete len:237 (+) Transcript_30530:507-1217(+)